MSRWAADPEAAADALILRALDDIGLGVGPVLLVNQAGALPAAIRARGAEPFVWNRRLVPGFSASPWPPSGPFDVALLRLPKSRDELEMTLAAVAGVLAPAGRIVVYGGNDEGIRSAGSALREVADEAETVAARGHGRVLAATATQATDRRRNSLAAWRTVSRLTIGGVGERDWVSYPGTFAHTRLDEATALLIGALPSLPPGSRVLDYACGTGPVAAALLASEPTRAVDAMDNDTVALEALRENVPAARPILGSRVAGAGRTYRTIVSNPPIHAGIAEDHSLLERLIADAHASLEPGGSLHLVVQRRVPLQRLLSVHFGRTTVAAENARFRVWRAEKD